MSGWEWKPYVPVAQQRTKARKALEGLRKKGMVLCPVAIEGRTIARSFWGKGWCTHLESFSDYANRLPRGRTYVRNGSVCHLEIRQGEILALVSGSKLYSVHLKVAPLPAARWAGIKKRCAGRIGSMLELLQGRLSTEVMGVVTDRTDGLFPLPGELQLDCSCPDWASMCKHVAATLYGVGHRLDTDPGLLFTLRGVDAEELISASLALADSRPGAQADTLEDAQLADIFGIDLDLADVPSPALRPQSTDVPVSAGRGRPRRGKVPDASSVSALPGAKPLPSTATKAGKQGVTPARKTTKLSPSTAGSSARTAAKRFRPTGAAIRKLREKLGWSVEQLADRIGASAATVRRWEATRGLCRPHARLLTALQTLAKT